jgi:hypothetical protein
MLTASEITMKIICSKKYRILNFFFCCISFTDHTAGEKVEYELILDDRGPGSRSAHRVTGPDGVKVKGELKAPPRR